MPLDIVFYITQALRHTIKMGTTMQISTVIGLNKRLHLNAELFAIMKNGIVMAWQTPWSAIKIVTFFKIAGDFFAAKLGIFVTAIERPATTATTVLELEHLDIIARFTQLVSRGQAAKTGAKNDDTSARRCT